MNKEGMLPRTSRILFAFLLLVASISQFQLVMAQAVPYARTFAKSKEDVEAALKDFQAYAGQKLPIVDGFVAMGDQPLSRYERAFYQFSFDILPANSGSCVVRVTAKVTAWYADRDPAKSGYQVLPSNGRLELDLLDRLTEKFGGKAAGFTSRSSLEVPRPKIDLPGSSNNSASPGRSAVAMVGGSTGTATEGSTIEEMAALRLKRESEEKRTQQLNTELQNLQELQHNQAHPNNLVIVKKSGTPVFARAGEGTHVLFRAAADDEFEFIEAEGEWIHVQISGVSRGYLRRNSLDLPEGIAARLKSANGASSNERASLFRVAREENGLFPGGWEKLKGKPVKIYTIQAMSQDSKKTGASAKLNFALSILEKFVIDATGSTPSVDGVVVIFDSADGGIIGATLFDVQQLAAGSLARDDFWKLSYMDPVSAFHPEP